LRLGTFLRGNADPREQFQFLDPDLVLRHAGDGERFDQAIFAIRDEAPCFGTDRSVVDRPREVVTKPGEGLRWLQGDGDGQPLRLGTFLRGNADPREQFQFLDPDLVLRHAGEDEAIARA
jgi:hypothetical protein